jgi:hypothetical protein
MIIVTVDAGACGMKTVIRARSGDMQKAEVSIESACPSIQKIAAEISEIDAMAEVFGKIGETSVYEVSRRYCKHAACPVPAAVIKAVEAACGLALPSGVSIDIEKE